MEESQEARWRQAPVEDRPRYAVDLDKLAGMIRGEHQPLLSPEDESLVRRTFIRTRRGEPYGRPTEP